MKLIFALHVFLFIILTPRVFASSIQCQGVITADHVSPISLQIFQPQVEGNLKIGKLNKITEIKNLEIKGVDEFVGSVNEIADHKFQLNLIMKNDELSILGGEGDYTISGELNISPQKKEGKFVGRYIRNLDGHFIAAHAILMCLNYY